MQLHSGSELGSETAREAAIHSIHSCLPAEFINETSGRRQRRRRRRRGFTREDGARTRGGGARRSVPHSLQAGSHASTQFTFTFGLLFNPLIVAK